MTVSFTPRFKVKSTRPTPTVPDSIVFTSLLAEYLDKSLIYETPAIKEEEVWLTPLEEYRKKLDEGQYSREFIDGVIEGLASSSLYESQTPQ